MRGRKEYTYINVEKSGVEMSGKLIMSDVKSIGNPAVLKNLNKSQILNVIRDSGPLSRSAIANRTKLGWGSIGKYVEELREKGMVLELGKSEATGGRPSMLLDANSNYGYFAGVTLGSRTTRIAIIDFKGKVRSENEYRTNSSDSSESVVSTLIERLKNSVGEFADGRLLGIGIGVSGEVDPCSGVVLNAGNFNHFKNVPLKTILTDNFDVEVFVMNKLTAITLGEMTWGAGRELDDFICVALGGGIGSGIVSMGRFVWPYPFRGIGDIGHMTIDKNGPMCGCGFRGCLDALAGGRALGARLAKLRPELTMESLDAEIVNGDRELREMVATVGAYIGQGIASVVQAYHPEKVILVGRLLEFGDILTNAVRQYLDEHLHRERFDPENVIVSPLEGRAGPIGAAQHVWNELYCHKIDDVYD